MGASEDKGQASRAARKARLAAALRENLRKRKAQARGRAQAGGSDSSGSDSGESDSADPPGESFEEPGTRDT